tara:strand:+ start:11939 stop:13336 length:1398 start_codon:yes stop_codon:yes gene_type:complete
VRTNTTLDNSSRRILKKSNIKNPDPAIVQSVEPGSIAEELGIQAGDKILSINGNRPRDLIDYQMLICTEEVQLEIIDAADKLHTIDFEKEIDDTLGIIFTEALFDGLKQCNNNCPFCFIDQQPTGKRKTLYIKDDDYRMSFLYGSYLTLTNLTENDWQRIETQHLSPLFVSVHSTNPNLRAELLRNPQATLLMEQINWFAQRNLQIHAQIVVCPGINDGQELQNTLFDLFKYGQGEWPTILSAAIVPVGLTRFRPDNDRLEPVDKECAKKVIEQVEVLQKKFRQDSGSRFAWLSDEWYLIAEKNLPIRNSYENLPQEENGVGSIRSFLEQLDLATQALPNKIDHTRNISWVVGKMVKNALNPTYKRLNKIENLNFKLFGLPSPYWGRDQVVTGLLTGRDLVEGLSKENLGEQLLIPSVMLKQGQDIFLDDMTIQEVSKILKVSITIVNTAEEMVNAAIGKKIITN